MAGGVPVDRFGDRTAGGPRVNARRVRRPTAWCLVAALAAVGGNPARADAQAEYSGPAVVPAAGAYVGEAGSEDGPHPRWRVEGSSMRTLKVFFEPPPAERAAFWAPAEAAIAAWNAVEGLPVTFRPTGHRSDADVRFRWLRRFSERQAGTTDWETNGEGWLSSVIITLALEHDDGLPMGDDFLQLVVLHELGHAIGLPHSEDPADVMHPGNRNRRLSERDVRSAMQLYEPAGSAGEEAPR